ncbi:hypothetical protein ACFLSK_01470, partial [Chloroflexota bacterium]
MQKAVDKETSNGVSAQRRTIWQRLTGNERLTRLPAVAKIIISLVVLAIVMVVVIALYANVAPGESPGATIDFPKEWDYGWDAIKVIDAAVDWVVINWEPFFIVIRTIVLGILIPFRDFLTWLPWWLVIMATGLLGWRVVGAWFGVIAVLFLGFM